MGGVFLEKGVGRVGALACFDVSDKSCAGKARLVCVEWGERERELGELAVGKD